MRDLDSGPLSQLSGALPMSHHISFLFRKFLDVNRRSFRDNHEVLKLKGWIKYTDTCDKTVLFR